jgi:hypothetical protein
MEKGMTLRISDKVRDHTNTHTEQEPEQQQQQKKKKKTPPIFVNIKVTSR